MPKRLEENLVNAVAFTEVLIGALTVISSVFFLLAGASQKPLNVLVFVLVTSTLSLLMGLGLYARNDLIRRALIFFSGYIALTKVMMFMGLFSFSGEVLSTFPTGFKNALSAAYHLFVMIFLASPGVRSMFPTKKGHKL